MKIPTATARLTLVALLLYSVAAPNLAQDAAGKAESFSVIVLPDTQCYADVRAGFSAKYWKKGDLSTNFFRQTEWIKQNTTKLNIACVLQAGDLTQTDYDDEWKIVDRAFKTLDGVVPYCLAVGNHDMGFVPPGRLSLRPDFAESRSTGFNKYFASSRFDKQPGYGGHFDDGNENSFCLFTSGGLNFMVVSLEFKPRDEVLAWANTIISEHKDRRCIILTHAYLSDGQPAADLPARIKGNAGAAIWEKLVSLHPSIFLVICGHEFGERQLTSTGRNGNTVHQLMANYEDQNGGEGYLRIMTFVPDQNRIEIKTYSPVLDKYLTGERSQFSLVYRMK